MARGKRSERISGAEFGRRVGLVTRHVYRLIQEQGFPLDEQAKGSHRIVWPDGLHWYIEYKVRSERSRERPKTLDQSRAAKLEAEARIAQMEAAKLEGSLITLEDHEKVLSSLLEVVRSALNSAPSSLAPRIVGCKTIPQASARVQPFFVELVDSLRTELEGLDEEDESAAA